MGRPAAPKDWTGWFVLMPEPISDSDRWWFYDWDRKPEVLPRNDVYGSNPEVVLRKDYRVRPVSPARCRNIYLSSGWTMSMCVYEVY